MTEPQLASNKDNNALFNRKFIQKAVAAHSILSNGEIPDKHKKIIEKRISNHALYKKTKERTLNNDFLVFFKELLGYKSAGDLSNAKSWDVEPEYKGIDYALGEFSKAKKTVLVPFELKGPDTYDLTRPMKGRKESTVEQATRYALTSQGTAKWFLVSNCLEFRLYKFPGSTSQYEQWSIEDLIKPDEYARFILLLSKTNLLGGVTEQLYSDSQQTEKDISDQLYRDYRQLRIDLINGLKKDNNAIRRKAMVRISQKLLDRMLFIAFAEDRGLLPRNTLHNRIFKEPGAGFTVWDVIKKLFADIDKGNPQNGIPAYNGGLFAADSELEKLTVSTTLLKKFKTLYDYDFDNDIGTPVLGHIFEQSIADLDEIYDVVTEDQELQGNAKTTLGTSGKRKQDGIVYTPEFITDYIIKHTLGGYLEQKKASITHEQDSAAYWLAYRDILAKTRVLDPACGSGAFLIGAFKYLKAEYDFVNRQIKPSPEGEGWVTTARMQEVGQRREQLPRGNQNKEDSQFKSPHPNLRPPGMEEVRQRIGNPCRLPGDTTPKNTDLFGLDLDADILNNNLFGVDLNLESIEITQLALWLETAEQGKKLKPLDQNIQQGNSIIHHKHTDKEAFLWKEKFKKVMDAGGFDVILGNPPYVRQERLGAIKPYLQEHYQTYHGVADLYTYFFELGIDLLKKGGRLGYISSSTFFRTNSGTPLREYLKVHSNILTVIDFNDYPVFSGVTTYPAILILEKPDKPRKQAPKSDFTFLNITAKKDPQHSALKQQLLTDFGSMKQATLKVEAWQLEDERFANLRQKITKGYKTLKEVYGSPLYGIKTGLNEAFVINQQQYEQLKQDDPDGKILKPFLEGKDLKRWRAESRGLYLILFPKGWTLEQLRPKKDVENPPENTTALEEPEAWAYLQLHYPNIAGHLSIYATQGRKRGDKGDFWWELRACAYYEQFENGKLIYNRFMDKSLFCYFDKTYFNNALNLIPKTSYFEAGLFNSNVTWFVLISLGASMSGGFYQIHGHLLDRIPIPTATDEQKKAIGNLAQQCQTNAQARYELEQKVQRRLLENLRPANNLEPLNTKLSEWWKLATVTELAIETGKAFKLKKSETLKVDLSNPAKQDEWETYLKDNTRQWQTYTQTIKTLEQHINTAVYALFDLTPEEIGLIERG
jgi:type I restriction-modification system DNA methylase subunit